MKYIVKPTSTNSCIIELVAETEIESDLFGKPEEEFTFLHHYQQALNQKYGSHIIYVGFLNSDFYPKKVEVEFENTKGIG